MIKMRVNNNKECRCEECKIDYKNTLEMYDIMFVKEIHTVCYDCAGTLFQKLLKASCLYSGKVKSKEDMARNQRYHARRNNALQTSHISINEENE